MIVSSDHIEIDSGFATARGRRPANEDFGGIWLGTPSELVRRGTLAVVADGVGGSKGGRVAAETAVRAFVDGYGERAGREDVQTAAARALDAANAWISAQGCADPYLAGMASTFTALILRGQQTHVVHVGDSRAYLLRDGQLRRLTTDHVLQHPDFTHVLTRAIGEAETIRIDYSTEACCVGDRLLLCTDGVHGILNDTRIGIVLREHMAAQTAAQALVDASLDAGSSDNVTVAVLDVLTVPMTTLDELRARLSALPIGQMPKCDDVIDDFELLEPIAEGRHSYLFKATDRRSGQVVAIKFPRILVAQEALVRETVLREIYVASHVSTAYTGEIIHLAPDRLTRLYHVMPYYDGENLEQRLQRAPQVSLFEGIAIAVRLSKAMAALHRKGILHRDVKPENIVLETAGLRLVDFGAALIPEAADYPQGEQPGTASFMAPELFAGSPASVRSEIYALGVALYHMFTRGYPYGEIEAFSRPRFGSPVPLRQTRPDLPVWLDRVIAKTVAVESAERFADTIELVFELENGLSSREMTRIDKRVPLYARNPVAFWKIVALFLAISLSAALARLWT